MKKVSLNWRVSGIDTLNNETPSTCWCCRYTELYMFRNYGTHRPMEKFSFCLSIFEVHSPLKAHRHFQRRHVSNINKNAVVFRSRIHNLDIFNYFHQQLDENYNFNNWYLFKNCFQSVFVKNINKLSDKFNYNILIF